MQSKVVSLLVVAISTLAATQGVQAGSVFSFFPNTKPCSDSTKCESGYQCYETENGSSHVCILVAETDNSFKTHMTLQARHEFAF
jgi:hypothetical protein